MNNLSQLLTRPLRAVPSKAVIFFLIIALLGFADATYLTVEHYLGAVPPCSITAGCEAVLTSSYASILGVPVSLLGALFYLAVLVGAFAYLENKHEKLLRYALALTIIGFIMSLWFVYVQVFIIGSYCIYCLGSALTSTILFVTAMEILKKYSNGKIQMTNQIPNPNSKA